MTLVTPMLRLGSGALVGSKAHHGLPQRLESVRALLQTLGRRGALHYRCAMLAFVVSRARIESDYSAELSL